MVVFSSIELARAQAATLSCTLFFAAHDQGKADMWWGGGVLGQSGQL